MRERTRRELDVIRTGPLATVQDRGRPGYAGLGVGHSGAADRASHALVNRLLGNDEGAAAVEVTFGGLQVRARADLLVALTGAPCPATIDGRGVGPNAPTRLPAGAVLVLDAPSCGLRTYVGVRGGIDVEPLLGSRSTDVLSGVGPPVLKPGTRLPVGRITTAQPNVEQAPVADPPAGDLELRVLPGPRQDWFSDSALTTLACSPYEVTSDSNRVGMRLSGPALERARSGELASEGMVRGALQVPPSGRPTLFLNDHPVTGGYPVIGVVVAADIDHAAQARPGQRLHFRVISGPEL